MGNKKMVFNFSFKINKRLLDKPEHDENDENDKNNICRRCGLGKAWKVDLDRDGFCPTCSFIVGPSRRPW